MNLSTLAGFGFGFVKVKAHDKRPIGDGWQHIAYSAEAAAAHLRSGGNVGAHGGELSSGIVWIDVDQGRTFDQFLATFPKLASSLRVTRDNAPGRGKVAIRVTDRIPDSTKWNPDKTQKSPYTELLSTGNQAVILGTHPSGAPYRLTGETVVEMTYAELSAIWQQWTGEPLEKRTTKPAVTVHNERRPQRAGDDVVEQVKAAWTAYSVFDHFGMAGEVRQENKDDLRLLGHGGLLVGDPFGQFSWRWSIPGNGAGFGGDQIHAWYFAKHGRLVDFHTDGSAFMETVKEMATAAGIAQPAKPASLLTAHLDSLTGAPMVIGYTSTAAAIEVDRETGEILHPDGNEFEPNESDLIRAEINELIDWCKSHSFEQFFPLELQLPNGYRTDSTDTRVAVALLNVCHERATFTPIISLRDLARRAGVGSHHTVSKALVRLDGWFCTRRADGVIDVARRLPTDTHSDASTMHMGNLRATYETRLDDDVFLTGYSRRKRAEATAEAQQRGVKAVGQVVCHKTGKVIVDDLPVKDGVIVGNPFTGEQMVENGFDLRVLSPWRVVLREYAAGLGESVLRIVDAIEIHGAMTRAELVEVTGKTKSAISRATLQAVKAGILTADQEHRRAPKIYSLCEDWRETVEDLRPKLKTYMLTTERQARDCQERIEYADRLLSSPKTEEDQRRRLEKRKARAQRRWAELMAILRPDVDPVLWSTAPVQMTRSFMDWSPVLQEHRQERTVRDMQTVSDLMQPDRLLRRRELAKLRTAAGRLNVKISTYDGLAYAAD